MFSSNPSAVDFVLSNDQHSVLTSMVIATNAVIIIINSENNNDFSLSIKSVCIAPGTHQSRLIEK